MHKPYPILNRFSAQRTYSESGKATPHLVSFHHQSSVVFQQSPWIASSRYFESLELHLDHAVLDMVLKTLYYGLDIWAWF